MEIYSEMQLPTTTEVLDSLALWGVDISKFTYLEWFIFGVAACSLVFSGLFLFLTVSKKIRYAIPSTVNCWFCNENTNIPYALRNNWTCSKCNQYNGFAKDGGYNKRIPAQYIESLNKPIKVSTKGNSVTCEANSNGLCSECNLNQELKCFQLASFVPSKETDFDNEIEVEQKRLDEIYDLCSSCKSVVSQALKRPSHSASKRIENSKSQAKAANSSKPAGQSSLGTMLHRAISSASFKSKHPEEATGSSNYFSDTETEDEEENNMKMGNLQIGSPTKPGTTYNAPKEEYFKSCDLNFGNSNSVSNFNSYPTPPSPPLSVTPPACKFVSSLNYNNDSPPLWKDYPMVHNCSSGIPSCYSYYDGGKSDTNTIGYHGLGRTYHQAAFNPTSYYDYRSSSMATVFGGRKPLIAPSRLYSQPQHLRHTGQQQCLTSFGGYGVFYGTADHLMIPPQFGNHLPLSRSSSQSSGFISQYDTNLDPTPPHSRFSTTTNSVYNQNQSLHPSVYAEQMRRSASRSPGSLGPTYNGYSHCGNMSPKPRGMMETCGSFYGQHNNGDTCSRLGPRGDKPEELNNDSQLYSDDEGSSVDDSFKTAIGSASIKSRKSRRSDNHRRHSKKQVPLDFVDSNSNKDNDKRRSVASDNSPTILSTLSKYLRLFYGMFLRLALFANILLLFCLFFVGRWPDFAEPYLSVVSECCENLKDYLEESFPDLSLDLPFNCRVVGYFYSASQDSDVDVIEDVVS